MELEIEYELADWLDFQSYIEKAIYKESKQWWDSMWVKITVWFIVFFLFFAFFQSDINFSWPTAGLVASVLVFYYALMVLNGMKAKRACQPIAGGVFLSRHKFIISDDGIKTIGTAYEAIHKWDIVRRIEKTDKALYLFIDSIHAFIFPLSKVSSIESLEALIKKNVTKHS